MIRVKMVIFMEISFLKNTKNTPFKIFKKHTLKPKIFKKYTLKTKTFGLYFLF